MYVADKRIGDVSIRIWNLGTCAACFGHHRNFNYLEGGSGNLVLMNWSSIKRQGTRVSKKKLEIDIYD